MTFKLTTESNKTNEDYIVVIERPDGSQIRVLIPREDVDTWAGEGIVNESIREPIGLNLVKSGHYT